MTLLDFGRHGAAALSTPQEARERFRRSLVFCQLVPKPLREHRLHGIEKLFRDDRLMNASVYLVSIREVSVVDRVSEHLRDRGAIEWLAAAGLSRPAGHDAVLGEIVAERVKRRASARVHFERAANDRGAVAVNYDSLRAGVVEVPERRKRRVFASGDLVAVSSLDIHRQRIDVVFGETELGIEEHLSLWRVLDEAGEELEALELPAVEQVNDLRSIETVPAQAIGMPREDAVCFASFDPRNHFIEDGATRRFCRLFLDQLVDDREAIALHERPEFVELLLNRTHLTAFVVGGFPGV